jgi:FAD:protein FMN transferase
LCYRSATAADALSTAFSLMQEDEIRSLLPRVDIERVHLIDEAGESVEWSPSLPCSRI